MPAASMTSGSNVVLRRSIARFTVAVVMPAVLPSTFSMIDEHDAHVIPPTANVASAVAAVASGAVVACGCAVCRDGRRLGLVGDDRACGGLGLVRPAARAQLGCELELAGSSVRRLGCTARARARLHAPLGLRCSRAQGRRRSPASGLRLPCGRRARPSRPKQPLRRLRRATRRSRPEAWLPEPGCGRCSSSEPRAAGA